MKLGIVSLLLLAGCAAALSSCKKSGPEAASEPEPPPPVAAPAPAATPLPATSIAVATPVPDPLAPPGIFFLLQKASITTDDGIIGLKPGQSLRQVSPGTYEVNGQTVELRDDQVTNNLRIARQFAASDAASQAAWRQALQQAPAPPAAPTTAPATPALRPVARQPAPAPSNPLSGGTRLGGGTGAADPETANRRNVKIDSSGRQYWRDSRGAIRYDF